jgi:hypothetical protein
LFIYNVPGTYAIYQVTAAEGYRVGGRARLNYKQNGTAEIEIEQREGGETVTITALDESGAGIPEGCFYLARDNGVGMLGQPTGRGCIPAGSDNGVVRITGVPTGDYILQPAFVSGLQLEEFRIPVIVRSDEGAEIEVNYSGTAGESGSDGNAGSLAVTVVDDSGAPVINDDLCLDAVQTGGTFQTGQCDSFDNSTPNVFEPDGIVLITGLPKGKYLIEPRPVPAGYQISSDNRVTVTVSEGEAEDATLTLPRGGQTLTITSPINQEDGAVNGGCFFVREDVEEVTEDIWNTSACLDIDQTTGTMSKSLSVLSGDLVITQASVAPGMAPAPDQLITVGEGDEVTVEILPMPSGPVKISLVDPAGEDLRNACFVAIGSLEGYQNGEVQPFGEPTPAACDIDDGFADGVISILSLPAGEFTIVPVTIPSGFAFPAGQPITVEAGETTELEIEATEGGGRLDVIIDQPDTDDSGARGNCVAVFADDGGAPGDRVTQRCDSFDGMGDGTISFAGLPAGNYLVSLDPYGTILPVLEVSPAAVAVTDGETTETTITIPATEEAS